MTPTKEAYTEWVDGPRGTGAWEVTLTAPDCEHCRGLIPTAITDAKFVLLVTSLVMHHKEHDENLELIVDHTISVKKLPYQTIRPRVLPCLACGKPAGPTAWHSCDSCYTKRLRGELS